MTPRPDDDTSRPELLAAADRRAYGSTLSGCFGLVCVLALPALLFVPLDADLPRWVLALVPLVGVVVAGLGVWLVARVPPSGPQRRGDPLQPVTGTGRAPIRDVPAALSNRLALAACAALSALGCAGYLLTSLAATQRDILPGTLLAALAGGALVAYAMLALRRRAPLPAWRWQRLPLGSGVAAQPLPFLLLGGVALVWALIVAFEAGYAWAALGATLTVLAAALLGPLGQRMPPRDRRF